MRSAIIGFVCGAAWLQTLAVLPSTVRMVWLALCAVVCATLRFTLLDVRPPPAASSGLITAAVRSVCAAMAGALAGFAWAAWLAHVNLAPALAPADEGRDLTIVGTIDSLPFVFDDGVRFNFKVEQQIPAEHDPPAALPPRLALSWYAGFAGRGQAQGREQEQALALAQAKALVGDVQPGERWRLTVRLQRPHGNANPGGFDYEAWLLEEGVRATGYVRSGPGNARLAAFVPSFNNIVERSRATLRARILAMLAGRPYAGVIVALVVGDQRAIDQDDWLVFSRTGVSHLISISGLHITMVAGMAAWLAASLWRRSFFTSAALPLRLPAQKLAAVVGASTALLYVLLAGFGVPAQRTLYMLGVIAVALWCGRLQHVSQTLCLALGVVVALDPWAVLAPGFWLSFGAVALILYASTGRTFARVRRAREAAPVHAPPPAHAQGPPPLLAPVPTPTWLSLQPWEKTVRLARGLESPLRAALSTQYVVTVGLVPLTLLLFAQISLVSPLANAVAIPVVSFLVTPLALAGSVLPAPLAGPLLLAAHQVVAWLAALLGWLAAAPLAVWAAPMPSAWTFGFAMFGIAWLLAPRGWPLRWTGLIACLPALAARPAAPPAGQFTATVFDVGQGMAMLVETAHHRLLYDAGPRYSLDSNGGNRTIMPYLKARGIGALDAMVISHSDADHAGGALAVLGSLPVGLVLSSLDARHPIVRKATLARACMAGQQWDWDGVHFAVLHPTADSYADPGLKTNARSCTLRITAMAGAAFLTQADGGSAALGAAAASQSHGATLLAAGDIEAPQEAQLLARRPDLLAGVDAMQRTGGVASALASSAVAPVPASGAAFNPAPAMAPAIVQDPARVSVSAHDRAPVSAGSFTRGMTPDLAPDVATHPSPDASLSADVLLAPHHGSGTSSTPAFLAAVHPTLAIFQVGYRNRYHHPKSTVWQRYGEAGIGRWRTDETGAITMHFGQGVTAESYRISHARYWYGQ